MSKELRIAVEGTSKSVSGLQLRPRRERALFVLAHGAGAGMRHPFLESLAEGLAERGIGTLRYQFPYMEEGKRYPNPPKLLEATVRSAVALAWKSASPLPLLAGGKSLGGRMTSQTAAREALPGVRGLVFVGFPLHAPGKPGVDRAAHLAAVGQPMLFLQGTRDTLARRDLIESVVGKLGARGIVHFVEGGDHSFNVLKRSGREPTEVRAELTSAIANWATRLLSDPGHD
ncbi:MAG: alpha/beta family hydrolase [Thermoplasmata archaeon]